jgi:hypothetical protein
MKAILLSGEKTAGRAARLGSITIAAAATAGFRLGMRAGRDADGRDERRAGTGDRDA